MATAKKNIKVSEDNPQTIIELLGWALGVGGLRFDDFCLLTPFEFQAVVDAVSTHDDNQQRGAWERARIIGCMSLTPWSKSGVRPESVLPLPWDGERRENTPEKPPRVETKEEAKKRLDELLKHVKLE